MSKATMPVEQLIDFQRREIAKGKERMQRACNAGLMKPETMTYLLRCMSGVLISLERLQDLEASQNVH